MFKVVKILFYIIDEEVINYLFDFIDIFKFLGYRNLVILDLLYSCGVCVSEFINLEIKDIYLLSG